MIAVSGSGEKNWEWPTRMSYFSRLRGRSVLMRPGCGRLLELQGLAATRIFFSRPDLLVHPPGTVRASSALRLGRPSSRIVHRESSSQMFLRML